ncbi:ammonium transporter [Lentinula detonsa]|uniref:Ammonium transporter n=1 Tax=Lentinula detonsa TaxID=2804962 RepID=A0A9W8PCX9_9AGAR|nr:ammonium transporter [Lentinula detonsa]KAJ3751559.1 ammonium transporter [Lentinula detonsa]
MVNITYDTSGSIIYTDDSGTQTVYQNGDIAWTLTGTALVFIMIPGLSYFYSGLLRRKNTLSMIYMSVMTLAVVSFQWFFWGFSLAFSETGSTFIGDLKYFGMKGVAAEPSIGSARIPSLVFALYQLIPMLALGAVSERGRLGPCIAFVFIWSTLVYDPIACWTWNSNGWSFVLGGLDFAGGSPVHISSGSAALAISIYLGKHRGYGTERLACKPHNTSYVIFGTALLWFGWFGFNGGSALSANLRAAMACTVTNLAASVGGLTWMLWDYQIERKWSAVGFCSGAIAGLVAITPGSGFVGAPAAVLFGFMARTVCNFATQLKFVFGYDDTLDVRVLLSSNLCVVGNVLMGLFAQASVVGFDGITVIPGGWLDHHYIQLGYQLADSIAALSYSFVMTTIILWLMHFIPFLRMRSTEEAEIMGLDEYDMGEFAYDYVGLEQEIGHEIETKVKEGMTSGGREPHHEHHHHHVDENSLEKGQ